jgi:hypothetical protein
VPAGRYIGQFLATFTKLPPSLRAGSWPLDDVMQALRAGDRSERAKWICHEVQEE